MWLRRRDDAKAIHSPFSAHPIPHGRTDEFFIHGHGRKGSDGCLVPDSDLERMRLTKAIKEYSGAVTLLVKNVSYQLPAEVGDNAFA